MKETKLSRNVILLLICVIEAGVLWGVLKAVGAQARQVDVAVSVISDLKDPSPFRVALLGHLDKIKLSLAAYLRSPEPTLLTQIAQSQKDFESSLPEFEAQNKRLFPPAAGKAIRTHYDTMKSSLEQAVDISAKRSERQKAIDNNFKQMIYLIDQRIRPLLRGSNPDLRERLDAVLKVENQLRAWQQNLGQAWAESSAGARAMASENDSKGQSLLEDYSQMQLKSAERKSLGELSRLWKDNEDLARQGFALLSVQTQALTRLKTDRDRLTSTLSDLLPAMRPQDVERHKLSVMSTIRARLITAAVIGLGGVFSIIVAIILAYRQWVPVTDRRWKSTFEIDLSGSIVNWSLKAKDLYGYTAEEIRGQSVATIFSSESEIARLHQKLKSGDETAFDTTHKIKGGGTIPVRIQFLRMTDKSGQLTAIGLSCTKR